LFVIDEVGARWSRMVDFCDSCRPSVEYVSRLMMVVENVMKTQVFVR